MKIKTKEFLDAGGMSKAERLLTTGQTSEGHNDRGKSHNPIFRGGSSYPYPLYKLHKLSPDEIKNKTIPPHRLVTAMQNFPTARLEKWLCNILTPVSTIYCSESLIKDSKDFLNKIMDIEETLTQQGITLFTVDVDKLYPSINTDILLRALEDALYTCTAWTTCRIDCILTLSKLCLGSAAVQYRGKWYKLIFGLTTGGAASVPWANIFMTFVLKDFVCYDLLCFFKFIDDLFGGIKGSVDDFHCLLSSLNAHLSNFGLSVSEGCSPGKIVNFLDTTVDITNNNLTTYI